MKKIVYLLLVIMSFSCAKEKETKQEINYDDIKYSIYKYTYTNDYYSFEKPIQVENIVIDSLVAFPGYTYISEKIKYYKEVNEQIHNSKASARGKRKGINNISSEISSLKDKLLNTSKDTKYYYSYGVFINEKDTIRNSFILDKNKKAVDYNNNYY